MDLPAALHALNEAAYAAEKSARRASDPRAEALRNIMWLTDAVIDTPTAECGALMEDAR